MGRLGWGPAGRLKLASRGRSSGRQGNGVAKAVLQHRVRLDRGHGGRDVANDRTQVVHGLAGSGGLQPRHVVQGGHLVLAGRELLAGQGAGEILHCCVELLHVRKVVAGHRQSAATRLRFPWLRPGKCAGTVARPLVWPHLGGEAVSSGPTRQDIMVTLRNPPSSPHSPLCRVGPLKRLVTVLSEVR